MKKRLLLSLLLPAASLLYTQTGETLPNGIVLPAVWPPSTSPTQAFRVPSYLTSPPAVIPIDVGRQLFVDEFLIAQTTLNRVPHRPAFYPGNPVLTAGGPDPTAAMPYSDGVWYDPADNLFKMFYYGAEKTTICYAYSIDGRNWVRPQLPNAVTPNTNQVLYISGARDSATVWMDLFDSTPGRKFKAFYVMGGETVYMNFSADGITWGPRQPYTVASLSDRTTVFFNPFRNKWVESARMRTTLPATPLRASYTSRTRYYSETPDLMTWTPHVFWTGPDDSDPIWAGTGGAPPELYNLDAVAYESLLVGLFSFWHPGPEYNSSYGPGPNLVEMNVGFSRDGFQWDRPTRGFSSNAFIPASNIPGTWDYGNTQSAGGGFLVVGDELWFYFSGRSAKKPSQGIMSTGLATLRRDGFYSMDAGATEGTLTTRPVRFSGGRLFVNVDAPNGELRAEILDANGSVIAPFSRANSVPAAVNKTLHEMTWSGVSGFSSLAGQPVRFRFYLRSGALYSFWVSGSASGPSGGYVAAGGPGFTGPVDNRGSAALPSTAATPVIWPGGGLYTGGVTVTLLTGTPGAGIRFTVDGSEPSSSSPLYTAPFTLQQTAVLKARAFKDGLPPSPSSSASFVIGADTVPPAVTITSPASGQTVRGIVSIMANASDNGTVAGVQFKVDGVNLGSEVLAAPYAASWNTLNAPDGPHSVSTVVRDGAGNVSTATVSIYVLNQDVTAPSVQVTSPAEGQAVSSLVTLTASANDNVQVAGIQFQLDGVNFGAERTSPPFSLTVDSGIWTNGPHTLAAVARDSAGNQATSVVNFNVANTPAVPPGPAGFWSFNTSDISGNMILDRTANGLNISGSSIGSAAGKVGAAGSFNGSSSGAAARDTATDLTSDLTVSVWIRTTSSGLEGLLTRFDAGAAGYGYLVRMSQGHLELVVGGANVTSGVEATASDSTPLNDGAWHHAAIVMRLGSGATFFIDGAQRSFTPLNLRAATSTMSLRLGVNPWTPYGNYFRGEMDQVRIYRRSLTAAEVQQLAGEAGTNPSDTTPPTVSIASPSAGQTVSGTLLVAANANDNFAVAGVQLKCDGVNMGTELTAAPYARTVDTTSLSNGTHTLSAVARDAAGNSASAAIVVTVSNLAPPPPVTATISLATSSTLTSPTQATVTVSDSSRVAGVQFALDGTLFGAERTMAPFTCTIDPATLVSGSHILSAVVRQIDGNAISPAPVSFTTEASTSASPAIASWSFETATVSGSTLLDGSGNGLHATAYNASFGTGKVGRGLVLSGSGYASVPSSALLNPTSDLTISLWLKTANNLRMEGLVSRYDSGGAGNGYLLRTTWGGNLELVVGGVNSTHQVERTIADPTRINDNNWHHVAVLMRLGSDVTFYVDGVRTSSTPINLLPATNLFALRVGANLYLPQGDYFRGSMDEVRVFRRALSAAEIRNQLEEAGTLAPDTTPPSVTITSPAAGQTLSGSVIISATVTDASPIGWVQFQIDGAKVGTELTTAPYAQTINLAGLLNGSHVLTATARDTAGNIGNSQRVTISVSNPDPTPPSITITFPTSGQTVSGQVTVTTATSSNVAGVQLKVDGVNLGTEIIAAPFTGVWDTRTLANGAHTLTAVARSVSGIVATSAPASIQVSNSTSFPTATDAFWSFDEPDTSGTTLYDRSGNNLHATATNTTFVVGRSGRALSLSGSTSYALAPSSTVFNPTADIAYALWIKTTNTLRWEGVLSRYDAGGAGNGHLLRTSPSGTLEMVIGGANNTGGVERRAADPTVINNGAWHHVVVVIRLGEGITFFVDGRQTSFTAIPIRSASNSMAFRLGMNLYLPSGDYFRGMLDQVRIYRRTLSASEIGALYQEGAP